jgi:D-alanyl-lipoteichoic acid acyltransferase DltB (MBOAT superfamily)
VFAHSVARHPYPRSIAWASLIGDFLETMLNLSIWGNAVVACCRMTGFRAFRNTYRPFRARTIAEFWNRYYYYFKELLVDCFFYPTFFRYCKSHRRLRLFVATFAAACFGNVFYHFFRDLNYIKELGFWKALAGFDAYIFYSVVLAAGIAISQLRQRPVKTTSWIRGRFVPTFCVISFFCILSVFGATDKRYPIQECFRFLAHLFNLAS